MAVLSPRSKKMMVAMQAQQSVFQRDFCANFKETVLPRIQKKEEDIKIHTKNIDDLNKNDAHNAQMLKNQTMHLATLNQKVKDSQIDLIQLD